ncbi:MAG: hypothetical protein GXO27_01460 [Chlorobi bacterium]|nr:hypothetical protein [Chlorobiota bacterium]
MKVLAEKILKWKIVETKTGAKLIVIEEDPNHYWIEQNPLKESKYGVAYRELKKLYPDIYLFWEIKDGDFTGRLKVEMITGKKTMDRFIESLLGNKEFLGYEDINANE